MAQQELTQEQLDERIAILKRFRQLLEQQRRKFREYLVVLEHQAVSITSENVDSMISHTEIEQSIVAEISTIQKVMDPLEVMYRDAYPSHTEAEIPHLKADLDNLRSEVLQQNEKNRELLKSHMHTLRQKVIAVKPYANRSSIYAANDQTATKIDISQ